MAVHDEDGEGVVEYQLRHKPNNNLQPWLRDKIISEARLHSGFVPGPCPLVQWREHPLRSPLLQGQDLGLLLFSKSAVFSPILKTTWKVHYSFLLLFTH